MPVSARKPSVRVRDLPVVTKVMAGVVAVALSAAAVVVLAVSGFRSVSDRADAVYDDGVTPISALGALHADVLQTRAYVLNYFMSDANYRATIATSLQQLDADIATVSDEYASVAADPTLAAALAADWAEYAELRDGQMLPAAARNDLKGFWLGYDQATQVNKRIDAGFEALGTLQAEQARSNADAVHETASSVTRTVVLVGVLGLLAGLLVALLASRAVVRRLRRVTEVLEAVADGDLTQRAEVDSTDEVGTMAVALGRATDSMRSTVATITANAGASPLRRQT